MPPFPVPQPPPDGAETTPSDVLARLAAAEDTLRAIGAGEVDAFVVSDGGTGRRVFTLSTADRPYRMFVENMRDGAATLSAGGVVLYANRRLAELLGRSAGRIVGSPLSDFVASGAPLAALAARGRQELRGTFELDLVDGDGRNVPVLVGSSPLEVDGDRLTCLTFTDLRSRKAQEREIARLGQAQATRLSELQHAQAALTEQATHDSLTGLPNRALLVDRIEQALAHAERSGRCTAVLFVDLDRFKQINDTMGHAAGDAALRQVADRLVALLRPMDTVARIGGDEFVVLARDLESKVEAIDLSARLVDGLAHAPGGGAEGRGVGASIGVTAALRGRGTAEGLLDEADTAMYLAKSLGGGRAEVFDAALGQAIHRKSTARQMLQLAIDDRRIAVHYQPIVDCRTSQVAGFEALARIRRDDGGVVRPAAFIEVAEESGLIVPLGAQVLEIACREARHWRAPRHLGRDTDLAVNLSSRQFESGQLLPMVRRSLAESGLDPSRLHLELTETAVMGLRPEILRQLAELRDLGVEVGLDDFGTGYASLTHLRRLPLSFVKIDQTFVRGLATELEDERIVSAVVDLAANLGLRSIAEGVETPDQLERLCTLGCDQAQGYLFARPMALEDVTPSLRTSSSGVG
jgi:diguanylate cyclase (GGDEF)-like protein/PAS domain S-box-containing protein